MATGCYPTPVDGLTIKLDSEQNDWLTSEARTRGCSKATVVRDLIDRQRSTQLGKSLHERMRDLCGSLNGSKDLSTRKLKGYGRD